VGDVSFLQGPLNVNWAKIFSGKSQVHHSSDCPPVKASFESGEILRQLSRFQKPSKPQKFLDVLIWSYFSLRNIPGYALLVILSDYFDL